MRREFLETSIQLLNETGTTILFSSHHMGDVERMAGRIVMLHEAKVLLNNSLDELREAFSLALFCLLPMTLFLRMLRVKRTERRRKFAMFTAIGGVMLIHLVQYVPLFMGYMENYGVFSLWKQVVSGLEGGVPGGTSALWLLSGAMVLGFYRLAELQFSPP